MTEKTANLLPEYEEIPELDDEFFKRADFYHGDKLIRKGKPLATSSPMHNPPHPGLLLREYMNDKTVTEFAKELGVTRAALSRILNGKAGISADMSVRLGEVLQTSEGFWLNLQRDYDLWHAIQRRQAQHDMQHTHA